MSSAANPGRLEQVDALRGFALFGILVVNIGVFSSPFYGAGVADPAFSQPLDLTVRWLIAWLFETKFYLLFSFLFGYSFTLQMAAAERSQAAFAPRFLRRLAGLAVLGAAHAVLFYQGDILLTYALLGLALLLCRRMEPRRALRISLWLIVLTASLWAILGALSYLDPVPPGYEAQYHADALAAIDAYRGTIGTTIAQHVKELTEGVWFTVLFVQGPFVFAMFLTGYALGRRHALADPWRQPRALWLLCALGLAPGLAGSAVYAFTSMPAAGAAWELPGLAADLLTAPLLSMSYAAALLLAMRTRPGARFAGWLAPAGRMALSNYLMQSIICAFLFTAWGLRLFASVSPLAAFCIAVAIFAAQLPLSAWWLRRHAYGPVEWFLRALTIGAWPAWRRARTG
ncbi:DUF418 domain-containing protein [Achromobacter insolitus]|uniref:DUF418 domain-containing protein n=1 Tax=Achromobacter TaxID=222 RepID=UPI0007C34D38|nr:MULTISPECIES: DUF418 domain-containing protein [Achromobacter]MDH3065628.1 DUF418 domain-containing protein [Achromobacter insolitus]MDQ6212238.1 DUF418 domain-containing protein [Achromobacter insolitus]MEB3099774.1 DUF418 domain-containing protein [Achromobacter sp. D10]NGT18547.1 DUF418 domain-containing protein [Achromobacter insolitus]OAD17231.1 hypothetical protein A3839_24855 [Achromobacter insolitus]